MVLMVVVGGGVDLATLLTIFGVSGTPPELTSILITLPHFKLANFPN